MNNAQIWKRSSGKKGNCLGNVWPRTVWATGAIAPAAPVAPAPLSRPHFHIVDKLEIFCKHIISWFG